MPQNLFQTNDIVDLGNVSYVHAAPAAPVAPVGGWQPGVQPAAGVVSVGSAVRFAAPSNRAGWAPARPYMWLPYVTGKTNFVALGTHPVLSGPFSGCYMIEYQQGGVHKICHVATPEAKATWNTFVLAPNVTVLRGFRPSDHAALSAPLPAPGGTGDCAAYAIFGLMTATEMYALFCYKQQVANTVSNSRFRIASIAGPVVSLPVHSLTNLP